MVLLFDTVPEGPYTGAQGHRLGIRSDWPIETRSSWSEAESFLRQDVSQIEAILLHTSDARTQLGTEANTQIAAMLCGLNLEVPAVFFSGGGPPAEFEDALLEAGYLGSTRSCSGRELRGLLTEYQITGFDPGIFVVTRLELTLQFLTALLPYGFSLENSGDQRSEAAQVMECLVAGLDDGFERTLGRFVIARVRGRQKNAMRSALMSGYSGCLRRIHDGGANPLLDRLAGMCDAATHMQWNEKLSSLRDHLLAECK